MPWLNFESYGLMQEEEIGTGPGAPGGRLAQIGKRVSELDGRMKVEMVPICTLDLTELGRRVEQTANRGLRRAVFRFHCAGMVEGYVIARNRALAAEHGALAERYCIDDTWKGSDANNLGYLHLAQGERGKARELLERAVEMCETPGERALAQYNLCILHLQEDDRSGALDKCQKCLSLLETADKSARRVGCVFEPKETSAGLKYEEVWETDLIDVATKTRGLLERLLARLER